MSNAEDARTCICDEEGQCDYHAATTMRFSDANPEPSREVPGRQASLGVGTFWQERVVTSPEHLAHLCDDIPAGRRARNDPRR